MVKGIKTNESSPADLAEEYTDKRMKEFKKNNENTLKKYFPKKKK